jgi:hypothetical protein
MVAEAPDVPVLAGPVDVAPSVRVVFSSLMLVAPSVAARPRRIEGVAYHLTLAPDPARVEGVDTPSHDA